MRAYSLPIALFLRWLDRWSIEPFLVDDANEERLRARAGQTQQRCATLHSRIFTARGTLMTRLIALLLIAGTAVLAGCNTMSGAGQDISKGGQAITNSAEEHK
jgi:predicted small secreted protein